MTSTATVDVRTRLGTVRGTERMGAETFWGLRFAQPARRFRSPEPATRWDGVWDATTPKTMAMQRPFGDVFPKPPGTIGEDCLYLNIHRPARPGGDCRPVLFWIHGGAGTSGAANQYDGSALALEADAVVVCTNYRLGLLGGLDLSALGSPYEGSRGLALEDLVMSLRWVSEHIDSFGGDPGCVTIIGESAGASNVLALCAAPGAAGLFHRAVASSPADPGPLLPSADPVTALESQTGLTGRELERWLLDADPLAILDLKDVSRSVVGSRVLPHDVGTGIRARGASAVPLIAGYAPHEGDCMDYLTLDALGMPRPVGRLVLHLMLTRGVVGPAAGDPARSGIYRRRLVNAVGCRFGARLNDALWTDLFRRSSIQAAEASSEVGSRGYVYVLDVPCQIRGTRMRSTHGVDIPLTFDEWSDPDRAEILLADDPGAPALAKRWVAMLATFARTGDPSGPLGYWPPYEPSSRTSLLIRPRGGTVEHDRERRWREDVWVV